MRITNNLEWGVSNIVLWIAGDKNIDHYNLFNLPSIEFSIHLHRTYAYMYACKQLQPTGLAYGFQNVVNFCPVSRCYLDGATESSSAFIWWNIISFRFRFKFLCNWASPLWAGSEYYSISHLWRIPYWTCVPRDRYVDTTKQASLPLLQRSKINYLRYLSSKLPFKGLYNENILIKLTRRLYVFSRSWTIFFVIQFHLL